MLPRLQHRTDPPDPRTPQRSADGPVCSAVRWKRLREPMKGGNPWLFTEPRVLWACPTWVTPRGPGHQGSFPAPGNRPPHTEQQGQRVCLPGAAGQEPGRGSAGLCSQGQGSVVGLGSRQEAGGPLPALCWQDSFPRSCRTEGPGSSGAGAGGPRRSLAVLDAAHTSQPGGFPHRAYLAQQAGAAGQSPPNQRGSPHPAGQGQATRTGWGWRRGPGSGTPPGPRPEAQTCRGRAGGRARGSAGRWPVRPREACGVHADGVGHHPLCPPAERGTKRLRLPERPRFPLCIFHSSL